MIQFDSRKVQKGDVFVAIKGLTVDGHDYIEDAKKRGAVKIYSEGDTKEKLGELASEYYGNPSSKLKVIGVTGTKGKTTTAHIIHHILTSLGKKAGLISSISVPGLHVTNPDVVTLNKMLNEFVDLGYEYAVVEVSSHGIDQGRISGINFEVSVLTNISPEHLDYHKTFKEYKRVKISFLKSGRIQIISAKTSPTKILQGEFNNINADTAVEVAERLGLNKELAIKAVESFELPEGRLEEVETNDNFRIFIDFAHTPNSLEAVLKYLRTITTGRLISVFGCASERDTKKRSKMGKISTDLADFSIFTTEDSRSENILDILRRIRSKADKDKSISIPDRGEAIAYAINNAKKGDVIGFFGKGHEKSMSYFGFEHPWNDKEFILNQLNGYKNLTGVILAGGKGTRMKTKLPKILNTIAGRPMISYSLENLRNAGIKDIVTVLGFKRNIVLSKLSEHIKYAVQPKPLGTGNAVLNSFPKVPDDTETLLVINGDDSAFYTPQTIKNVIELHKKNNSVLTFVSLIIENPLGLGRVVRDDKGNLLGTVEEKNATDDQKMIREVNDGLYIFNYKWLKKNIFNIKKNAKAHEYYLTDLIKIGLENRESVSVYQLPDPSEWQGINTPEQLMEAQTKMVQRLNTNE